MKTVKTPCCKRDYTPVHGYSPIRQNYDTGEILCFWCGCSFEPNPTVNAIKTFNSLVKFIQGKRLTEKTNCEIISTA